MDKKKFQSIPKRGEKDFEPDGTRKQKNLLQEGRDAMYSALSFDAGLYPRSLHYFPNLTENMAQLAGFGSKSLK